MPAINVRLCGFLGLFRGSGRFWAPIFYYLGHLCGAILDPLGILAQRQWKVLEIGGGTDDGACVRMHTIGGSGGMLPQIKIRCSEITSEITSEIIFVPKCH